MWLSPFSQDLSVVLIPIVLVFQTSHCFTKRPHKPHRMAERLSFRYYSLTAELWGHQGCFILGQSFTWPLEEAKRSDARIENPGRGACGCPHSGLTSMSNLLKNESFDWLILRRQWEQKGSALPTVGTPWRPLPSLSHHDAYVSVPGRKAIWFKSLKSWLTVWDIHTLRALEQ